MASRSATISSTPILPCWHPSPRRTMSKKKVLSPAPQAPHLAGLDAYIEAHSDPEPDYLYRLWRATNVHMLHGRMASGHLQGRLLTMLVRMMRPHRILEVGTFSGYSALCMAEGLASDDDLVVTFERNDEQEDFTQHSQLLPVRTCNVRHHQQELKAFA